MGVTNYYSVDGEILGERSAGGRINYGVDALGSVTSTMSGDAVQNTYQYKPYGALLTRTGSGSDPAFQWVGTQGYRPTGRNHSEQYVRARHYGSQAGRWSTVDPLWPYQPQYGYAWASPATLADYAGLSVGGPFGDCGPYDLGSRCREMTKALSDSRTRNRFKACLGLDKGSADPEKLIQALEAMCNPKGGPRICVTCGTKPPRGWPPSCGDRCNDPGSQGVGKTIVPPTQPPGWAPDLYWIKGCAQIWNWRGDGQTKCLADLNGAFPASAGCDCVISLCRSSSTDAGKLDDTLAHEMTHCMGFSHIGGPTGDDLPARIGCCMCYAVTNGSSSGCHEPCKGVHVVWPL